MKELLQDLKKLTGDEELEIGEYSRFGNTAEKISIREKGGVAYPIRILLSHEGTYIVQKWGVIDSTNKKCCDYDFNTIILTDCRSEVIKNIKELGNY